MDCKTVSGFSHGEIAKLIKDVKTNDELAGKHNYDESKRTIAINLNKKPIIDIIKPIRNNVKCTKTLAVRATLWIGQFGFGLKSLKVYFKEDNEQNKDDEEHQLFLQIYKDKVYESYHHYNNTTVGPLHYHLTKKNGDKELNEQCIALFNTVSDLFKKPKRMNSFQNFEVDDSDD